MDVAQTIVNGLALGALYACLAVGFSLVWGVLNVINMLHGTFVVLGGYLAFFMWSYLGVHPILAIPVVGAALFVLGFVLQYTVTNKVIGAPVLTTLTLTFGLDMLLYNIMTVYFTATPRRIRLDLGSIEIMGVQMPADRLIGMALALALTGMLYYVMRTSKIGRAIVAVRMDRMAAQLMGIRINTIYAVTFGIGAMVPGAFVGGLILGVVESVAAQHLGPQVAPIVGFLLLLFLLLVKPTGLMGVKGYE
jgi:branched-chain amino acid transport system permease protein